jgi:hypothetical protein
VSRVLPETQRLAKGTIAGQFDLTSAASRILPWLALAPILAIGLFLRLYKMGGDPVTVYPDTYAQIRAIENLLSASFPISYLYPPGIAIALAPIFAFVPPTIHSMRVTIEVAGMALILVALLVSWHITRDRLAALFLALAVAVGAAFVFYSRVVWFDTINLLLVLATVMLAPCMSRRGTLALIAYGVLVFATVTVRYTNAVLLPVLFLASLEIGSQPLTLRDAFERLRSRPVIIVGSVIVALYLLYIATTIDSITRFFNPQAGSVVDLHNYFPRLARYIQASLVGYGDNFGWLGAAGAIMVAGLAAIGGRRLWHTNRAMMAPIALLLLAWSPVHALYNVFASRYAMPAFFFVLLLAGYGLATAIGWAMSRRRASSRALALCAVSVLATLTVGLQVGLTTSVLGRWPPSDVGQTRENAYNQIRDVLRDLDGTKTTLVSTQTLALDRSNPEMDAYDLIRHSETYGINEDSVDRLLAYIREEQAEGHAVYYHYTEFEDLEVEFQKYELNYLAYFDALRREFTMRGVVFASERQQRLYLIEPRDP